MKQLISAIALVVTFSFGFAQNDMPENTVYALEQTDVPLPVELVCHQTIQRKGIKYKLWLGNAYPVSSGFLIAPGIVLTAAHNVYSIPFSFVVGAEVQRKRDGAAHADSTAFPDKCATRRAIRVNENYRFKGRYEYDFALLDVPTADSSLNYIPVVPFDSSMAGAEVYIAGYPAGNVFGSSKRMVLSQGKITGFSFEEEMIYHDAFTEKGSSGSAVLIHQNGSWSVIGVHVHNGGGTCMMTPEKVKEIARWQYQLMNQ